MHLTHWDTLHVEVPERQDGKALHFVEVRTGGQESSIAMSSF